jgi:ribose transport system permease protein
MSNIKNSQAVEAAEVQASYEEDLLAGAAVLDKKEIIRANFRNFFNFKTNEKLGALLGLFVLMIVSSILSPHFLSFNNLFNILRQYTVLGLMVIGMCTVILTGSVDLSAGSTLAFCGIIIGLLKDQPFIVIFLSTVATGLLIGFINGYLIAVKKMENYIATLGMQIVLRGLCLWITHSSYIADINSFGWLANTTFVLRPWLRIPLPVIILVLMYIIIHIIYTKTVFGKNLYAIGGNPIAAKLSGVKTEKMKISAFAALVNVSRLSTAEPLAGVGFEADAVAASLVGGASLAGGRGSISGAFIGLCVFGSLYNIMNLLGVQSAAQQVAKGIIIIGAVLMRLSVQGTESKN